MTVFLLIGPAGTGSNGWKSASSPAAEGGSERGSDFKAPAAIDLHRPNGMGRRGGGRCIGFAAIRMPVNGLYAEDIGLIFGRRISEILVDVEEVRPHDARLVCGGTEGVIQFDA